MSLSAHPKSAEVLVSVLMITYNHEKFIEKAIKGVLSQQVTFSIELLICNDASTDETAEVVKSCIRGNSSLVNIRFEDHQKNLGMIKNFKTGLELCRGKYTAICEGDDYWTDPLKLKKQTDFLEANLDYTICWTKATYFETQTDKKYVPASFDLALNGQSYYTIDLNSYYDKYSTPTLTAVFVTSKMVNFNLSKFPYLNDSVLFFILLSQGKGALLNFNSSVYRIHSKGQWSGADDYTKKISIFYALDSAITRIHELSKYQHLVIWRKWNLLQAYNLLIEDFSFFKNVKQVTRLLIKISRYHDKLETRKALKKYCKKILTLR